MGLTDNNDAQDRAQLLSEIRQRAEAAELARIEAEEARFSESLSSEEAAFPQADFPSSIESTASNHIQEVDTRKGDAPFGEMISFPPKSAVAATQRPPEKHHVADILSSARAKYEREEYEQALRSLDVLAALDPDNFEAATFRHDVEKAKVLSERLRKEEQRQKEEDAEAEKSKAPLIRRRAEEVPALSTARQDVNSTGFPDAAPDNSVTSKSRHPVLSRILSFLGNAILLLLGIAATFAVFSKIRAAYFPPTIAMLVLPPATSHIDAYVAEGLLDDLILQLSHLRSVRVFSANTSRLMRSSDGIATARLLGAAYVVDWNIVRKDGKKGISFSLVETATKHRVLEHASTNLNDAITEWCSSTASQIAQALGVDARDMQTAFMTSSVNTDAYDRYLLGRSLLRQPQRVSLDSIASVFNHSRQLDGSFPYAEASSGWISVLMHASLRDTSTAYLEAAQMSLQRTMSLGGSSSEVYRLWGVVEFFRSDFRQAIRRLEQATQLASSDVEAQHWLALAYLRTGRNGDALCAARAMVESDPGSQSSRSLLAMIHLMNNDPRSALQEFEFHFTRESNSYAGEYSAALVGVNQHERAVDILRERTQVNPRDFVALYNLGRMYQLAGKPKSAWKEVFMQSLRLIEDTLKVKANFAAAHSYRALVYTRLGRFADGVAANTSALAISPTDIDVLYNSARVFALQHYRSSEAIQYLVKAVNRRFVPSHVLDLDLARLRSNSELGRLLAQ